MAPATPIGSEVATFRFSSEDFSQRERLTAWREIFGRTVCSLDIEPLAGDRFRSDATVHARPGLGVLAGSSSAVHLSHSKNLIVDDDLSFMTGSMPKWTAFQRGRNPVLGPGDGVLMSNADVGSMSLPDTATFITFKVPVKATRRSSPTSARSSRDASRTTRNRYGCWCAISAPCKTKARCRARSCSGWR
jgi:hypothetical protein